MGPATLVIFLLIGVLLIAGVLIVLAGSRRKKVRCAACGRVNRRRARYCAACAKPLPGRE